MINELTKREKISVYNYFCRLMPELGGEESELKFHSHTYVEGFTYKNHITTTWYKCIYCGLHCSEMDVETDAVVLPQVASTDCFKNYCTATVDDKNIRDILT